MFGLLLHESMDPFYENISSFPTVVYTFVLAVCLIYWLGAVLGFIDLDVLDLDLDGPDADLDSGSAQRAKDYTPSVLAGLLLKLGLNGVPVTIVVSIMALFGWGLCYFIVHFAFPFVPDGVLRYLAGIPILAATLYAAALATSVAIRPLRRLFKAANANTVKHILGQSATVRTSFVDANFGEATLDDGGAGLILKVRAAGKASFKKGDRVVLLEYRKDSNTYRVVSESEFSG